MATFHSPGLGTQRVRGWRVLQKVCSFQEKKDSSTPLCLSSKTVLIGSGGFNDKKQTCGILEKLPSLESFTSDTARLHVRVRENDRRRVDK